MKTPWTVVVDETFMSETVISFLSAIDSPEAEDLAIFFSVVGYWCSHFA